MLAVIHIGFVGAALCVMYFADREAMAWMRGTKSVLDPVHMARLHHSAWFTLGALIATGTALALPRADYLFSQPLFVVKLLFVGVLVANGILIGRLVGPATAIPFSTLSPSEKLPLFVSGAVSFVSWLAVVAIALFIFES